MDGFASCLRAELARLSGAEILLVTNLGRTYYPSFLTYLFYDPNFAMASINTHLYFPGVYDLLEPSMTRRRTINIY